MVPSVHAYIQGIGQTKIMEKFIKQDLVQKKQIASLKKTIDDFDSKVGEMLSKIEKCQDEKTALEKLILEILAFGEQCDRQFDTLQHNYQMFEQQDRSHSVNIMRIINNIRLNLQATIKDMIAELKDNELRDHLLEFLTKLGNKNVDLDQIT